MYIYAVTEDVRLWENGLEILKNRLDFFGEIKPFCQRATALPENAYLFRMECINIQRKRSAVQVVQGFFVAPAGKQAPLLRKAGRGRLPREISSPP